LIIASCRDRISWEQTSHPGENEKAKTKKGRSTMSSMSKYWMAVLFAMGLATASEATFAQAGQSAQSGQSGQGQPPAQQTPDVGKAGNVNSVLSPPANAEELAAAKAFQEMPNSDLPKKILAGEEFLKRYPESQYRPAIYSTLVVDYLQNGDSQKAFELGDKEVALKPDDVQTLALLSRTIPRAQNSSTPNVDQQLTKAEGYAKRAIEVTPTIAKPEGMPDQSFIAAKNVTLAMAHSGLGLVYVRRGKFSDAIPELEQSIRIDPNPTPDPVNFYLLGLANQKAAHFDDAAFAYNRCAAITSGLQNTCRTAAEEAKKQASTQLSVPK
jgi:tetratricopeptide (TPR) repeat protein